MSFTSSWFLIPQGTGIVAVILHQLPYQFPGLSTLSIIFWIINIILLITFSAIYFARFVKSPRNLIHAVLTNTTEAACLASICVASTSAIQMLVLVGVPAWSDVWSQIALVLWWINFAMAVASCLGIPLIFVHSINSEGGFIRSLTPATQLPLIAALTSAAGGGTLCQFGGISPGQQIPVIIASYLEIGIGVPLALALDILFLVKVFQTWDADDQDRPVLTAKVYTDMVLCGPWGQSSFALQGLGGALLHLAPYLEGGSGHSILLSSQSVRVLGYTSMFSGLLGWGQGTFWWLFAVASILRSNIIRMKQGTTIPFGLSTWAIVFPWVSRINVFVAVLSYVANRWTGSLHKRSHATEQNLKFLRLSRMVHDACRLARTHLVRLYRIHNSVGLVREACDCKLQLAPVSYTAHLNISRSCFTGQACASRYLSTTLFSASRS